MQLEETGSSKDVPPLRCRGNLELSTIEKKNTARFPQREGWRQEEVPA